jgi:general stress protein YciG
MADNNNDRQGGGQGRGFAGMDPDKQRRIASMGGKAAHESGNANQFDSETGREAGRKGGQNSGGSNSAAGSESEAGR